MKGLVGWAAQGSADCRRNWTTALLPPTSGIGTHPTSVECAEAARIAWGGGRYKPARSAMRERGRSKTGIASLPHFKLAPISAPGPTGERQEQLDAIVSFAGAGHRRRLFRGIDILTIKWATSDLPEERRFLLNTQVTFLKKEKDPTSKQCDDDEWIRSLTEAQEVTTDVPRQTLVRPFRWESSCGNTFPGDFWHSVRENFAALTTSMRQIGVGTPGGAEALANFHQLIYDEWTTGSLIGPLARIKVDENSGFGMIGWKAVHEAASRFLPMHAAAAPWKRRNVSFVEQEGLSPMPKGSTKKNGLDEQRFVWN